MKVWLNNVAVSHSNSEATSIVYRRHFKAFCAFIRKTPPQILEEYKESTDRQFRRSYARLLRAFIAELHQQQLSPNTINIVATTVKSFFKYNDLPLGHVPNVRKRVIYHNRDITHDEIKLILDASRPRERAFYIMMAQSGLRPVTLCGLRYRHIREDLENDVIPCKVGVPEEIAKGKYHSYFTFIGREGVHYLQAYLNTRPSITDDSYLFVKQGTQNEPITPRGASVFFLKTLRKLHAKGLIALKQKSEGAPHNVRLYNLRKFFRKYAHQAGLEIVQFWMGHTVKVGVDEHYRPQDVDWHRKLYAEKALPYLRIETATPTENEQTIKELQQQLQQRDQELAQLRENMTRLQPLLEFVNSFDAPANLKAILDFLKDDYLESSDDKLRPLKVEFSPHISDKLDAIAQSKGITRKEALKQLVEEDLEILEERDRRFTKLEKRRRKRS